MAEGWLTTMAFRRQAYSGLALAMWCARYPGAAGRGGAGRDE